MLPQITRLAEVALELARLEERRTGDARDMRLLNAARTFLEACVFRKEQGPTDTGLKVTKLGTEPATFWKKCERHGVSFLFGNCWHCDVERGIE